MDGRWFSNSGDVQVDASNSNLISIGTAPDKQATIVRRGFRAGKYVLTYRFQWISGTRAGPLVRWVNPGDWIAVQLFHSDGKARLSKREADGNVTQLVTGTNSVSLTNNSWYTGRVIVGDDTGNSALQRLRFWVDTDGDGDFADETTLLDTTTIDDVWSAGHVGLFRGSVSNAQDFDDFKAGIDANADLDIADAGDEVVVDDDFATSVISPAYDNNGNLTDDGVNKHVYDGWNRHVKSTWRIKSPPSAVVAYEHDGSYRRVSKVVSNSGVENTSNDGGNTTQGYLFANGRLVEERNGSNQLTRAYMWHDGQLVWFEANGDPTIGNDSNPDVTATGEGSEAVADKRYFSHTDHGGSPIALSDYASGGGSANGRISERLVWSRAATNVQFLRADAGEGELLSVKSSGALSDMLTEVSRLGASAHELPDDVESLGQAGDIGLRGLYSISPHVTQPQQPVSRILGSSAAVLWSDSLLGLDNPTQPPSATIINGCCWSCPTQRPTARCNRDVAGSINNTITVTARCWCGFLCLQGCNCSCTYTCQRSTGLAMIHGNYYWADTFGCAGHRIP